MTRRKYKNGSLAERFWEYADKRGPDECWPWLASAEFWHEGSYETPIRAAWRVQRGDIPEGHTVYSRCRPGICVNAEHLLTGPNGGSQALAGELGKALKGEQVASARLTEEKVRHIRATAHSWDDVLALAGSFGVSPTCVYNVMTRKSWKHVG